MTAEEMMQKQIVAELNKNAMNVARMIKGFILAHRHSNESERAFYENCVNAAISGAKKNPEIAKHIVSEILDGVRKANYDYKVIVNGAKEDGVFLPAWSDVEIKFA